MIRKLLTLVCLFLFFKVDPISAVTVTISNTPPSITDQPFNIDVSVSGAQAGTNYLRANFFPAGTTKYFGFTYNGTTLNNDSDYSKYFPFTIDSSGNWNGTIQAKLDTDSSYYGGPGTYSLKVRRYTQSGSSYTWSNEVSLIVSLSTPSPTPSPTPTPSPSPTPTPTKTPSPTATPKKTATPTSTPTSTPNPTVKNTPMPSPSKTESSSQPNNSREISYRIASVAAVSVSATPEGKIEVKNEKQINPFLWIGSILIFAGAGAIGYIYLKKNAKI